MFGNNPQLDEVYPLAVSAKGRGEQYIFIEMEPRRRFDRFLRLFDGVIGRVIRRKINDTMDTESIIVEVNVADVLSAKRRQVERGEELLAAPLRANQLGGGAMPPTQR